MRFKVFTEKPGTRTQRIAEVPDRQTNPGTEQAKIQKAENKSQSMDSRKMLERDEHRMMNKDNLAGEHGEYF